jgi:hypothetical protein
MIRIIIRCVVAAVCASVIVSGTAQTLSLKQQAIQDPFAVVTKIIGITRLGPRENRQPFYQIDSCLYSDELENTREDGFVVRLRSLAFWYVSLAADLTRANYPEDVWRAPLNELLRVETDNLLRIYRSGSNFRDISSIRQPMIPYERRFLRVLENYRLRYNPSLGQYDIAESGGCGGDFIGYVKLATNPNGGGDKGNSRLLFSTLPGERH